MNKFRKFALIVAVVLATSAGAALDAYAAGYTNRVSVRSSKLFHSEWERTRTYRVGSTTIASMVYGYDTDFIDEDYAWTKSKECYSTAMVKRDGYDTSYLYGSQKGKNIYSKVEVTHETYYVSYGINLTATYRDVSYSTIESSVK